MRLSGRRLGRDKGKILEHRIRREGTMEVKPFAHASILSVSGNRLNARTLSAWVRESLFSWLWCLWPP